jgi:hypothetical protein
VHVIWFVLAAVVACNGSKAPEPNPLLSPHDVIARVRDAVGAAIPGASTTVGANDTLVITRGEWRIELAMDDVRRSCASSQKECDDAIAALAKQALDRAAK